jgi:hypothetical protein
VRRSGILLTTAIAWVGVVIGHLAAYVLTYPAQGFRHIHLALSGHSWSGLATASLFAVVPVILLTVIVRSLRAGATWSGGALALRLAAIQVPAFLAIEVMERGWSVGRTISDPAVFVGLVLQPLVAVIAAWIVELLSRTVRAIATLLAPPPVAAPRSLPRPGLQVSPPRPWASFPSRLRAPPASVSL